MWENEPSHSQVNSRLGSWSPKWTLESSKSDYKGQNSMDWNIPYIIKKLLKLRCLKWVCMNHLDIWNTSYGQKKGWESNSQFDSQPRKVNNHLDFLAWRWRATYHYKVLDEGYNFVWDLISIKGLHTKLWDPKVTRVQALAISKFPFENPEKKCHLDVGLVKRHIVYYKGEGGDFPQVRVMVNLVSLRLPMVRPNTKSAQTMH
jgi:hypothetical protein